MWPREAFELACVLCCPQWSVSMAVRVAGSLCTLHFPAQPPPGLLTRRDGYRQVSSLRVLCAIERHRVLP